VNDPDQTVAFPLPKDSAPARDQWPDEGLRDAELGDESEDPASGRPVPIVSLAFLRAALKRNARLWCATAVLGLVLGVAFYAAFPPAHQATTSILVTNDPGQDPADQAATNVTLAQSQAVAGQAIKQLGLNESVNAFIAKYTVTDTSTQVLVFTVNASSSAEAVRQAAVIASVFLQFRTSYLNNQLQTELAALNQQVTVAEQQISSVNQQIAAEQAKLANPAQQARLASLQTQLTTAQNALSSAQGNAVATAAADRATIASQINGSQTISEPTAVPTSAKKGLVLYVFAAFFVGLVIGMGIVIIRALTSDRLRRRDEIAELIGAPVKFSVGSMTGRRRLPGLDRGSAGQALDMRRLVTYLGRLSTPLSGTVPNGARRLAGLAIVAVDNTQEVAPAVVQLASSNAGQGKKVVVADLADGRPLARLLGVTDPGLHAVSGRGGDVVVFVPERDDLALAGPIPGAVNQPPSTDPELGAACASADLLFTLATLDPALGGDYLSTWATSVVAVVTTGRSSSARIRAVGEMIRLAGLRFASVVLLGADKDDESLGLLYARDEEPASPLAI
jgi:capsular polysaccharide biosynthesis protein